MRQLTSLILMTLLTQAHSAPAAYDIVIYGGTSAGVVAGIQAQREGRSVIVLEPTRHIGGLTTGGLGQTDIGNKQIIGGISREFYKGIRAFYRDPANWPWQAPDAYQDNGQTRTDPNEDAKWTFEPSAAQSVLDAMIADVDLQILTEARLRRDGTGVIKDGPQISEIVLEDGRRYRAKVFIDATYEGDLLAEAGVTYHVGRESNSDYDETLNGSQSADWAPTLRGRASVTAADLAAIDSPASPFFKNGLISMNAKSHQLNPGVDPYIVPGDPASGLLPGIDPAPLAPDGTGDHRVQAYNYRLAFTDHPDNRIAITKPAGYDPLNYELLLRHLEKQPAGKWPNVGIFSPMPNRKTDINNGGGFSTNLIGQNWSWPEASYEERTAYAERLKQHILGLFWTLAHSPRLPENFREWVGQWGLPKDEFTGTGHFSPQVYVREGRRMIGELVITQHHCERLASEDDIIGMAAYGMDSHHVRRYLTAEGFVRNEGNVQGHITEPYGISYRALTPKRAEATNLIVPVAVSSTHIAFGSIRMEPVFMLLGQSAASAAALAIEENVAVQDVSYAELRPRLLAAGQRLENAVESREGMPVGTE